jgi:3',5'-cyclic AMP phosphodiesterase CpdA
MHRVVVLALVTVLGLASTPRQTATPPFLFIQLSDPQFGFFNNDVDFPQETANFEFAVANVNRLQPDFVIITGDLINKPGDPAQLAEYDRIRRMISPSIRVYEVSGNHDIENAPTPESLAAYRKRYGPDWYVFQHKTLLGIVLNSTLIHTPDRAPAELAAQDRWLAAELTKARTNPARHMVVFQHHPWFTQKADEDDTYFNVPRIRRDPLLASLRAAGVKTLISGHYHQNAVANDAGFDAITTGAVGRPLGGSQSGFRAFVVTDSGIQHRFYDFGQMPTRIDPASGRGLGRGAAPATGS